MSEDQTVATETVSEETTPEATTDSTDVGALIAESKKYRKRSQDAEARLAKLESQLAKAEEAKLKEKEDFKTLYEKTSDEMKTYKAQADKWASYEEVKREALLNSVPEDERETMSKLDLETLEYVTNKVSNIKPNISEVAGHARVKEVQKPYSEMTDAERRANWTNIVNQSKLK
jgi:hypothetical protein